MPFTKNWKTNSVWSDFQTAKFYSLIDGQHKLCDTNDYEAARIIGCPRKQLVAKLTRFTDNKYTYALQRWKDPYQLYEVTRNVPLQDVDILLETVHRVFATYVPGEDATLELQMKYKYVMENHKIVSLQRNLMRKLSTSGLLEIMYNSARAFVAQNRPAKELEYFDIVYTSHLPRDCFVNVYSASHDSGITRHRDLVSFCTVVFCLLDNGEGKLVLTNESNVEEPIHLNSNDMITFARISHSVQSVKRSQDRITVNGFF